MKRGYLYYFFKLTYDVDDGVISLYKLNILVLYYLSRAIM